MKETAIANPYAGKNEIDSIRFLATLVEMLASPIKENEESNSGRPKPT